MGAIRGLVVGNKEDTNDHISPQDQPAGPFVRAVQMHPGVMGKGVDFAGWTVIAYALAAQYLLSIYSGYCVKQQSLIFCKYYGILLFDDIIRAMGEGYR